MALLGLEKCWRTAATTSLLDLLTPSFRLLKCRATQKFLSFIYVSSLLLSVFYILFLCLHTLPLFALLWSFHLLFLLSYFFIGLRFETPLNEKKYMQSETLLGSGGLTCLNACVCVSQGTRAFSRLLSSATTTVVPYSFSLNQHLKFNMYVSGLPIYRKKKGDASWASPVIW